MPILTPRTAANFAHILNDPVALKKAILEAKQNEEKRLDQQKKVGLRTVGGKIKKLFTFKKSGTVSGEGEESLVMAGSGGSLTGEKLVISKAKRTFVNQGAPVKTKVKLKPSQIAYNSTETKTIGGEQ